MVIFKSISPFPGLTLPSSGLKWKPDHQWSDSEKATFLCYRTQSRLSIGKPILYYDSTKNTPEKQRILYLLTNDSTPLAWAEIQPLAPSSFTTGFILWGCIDTLPLADLECLGPIISASFLILKTDRLRIVSCDNREHQKPPGHDTQTLWSLSKSSLGLTPSNTYEIRRETWEHTVTLATDLQALKTKMNRLDAALRHKKTPQPKKRGLLARLIKPKIDDALF